jgi:hypothetical protein
MAGFRYGMQIRFLMMLTIMVMRMAATRAVIDFISGLFQ